MGEGTNTKDLVEHSEEKGGSEPRRNAARNQVGAHVG